MEIGVIMLTILMLVHILLIGHLSKMVRIILGYHRMTTVFMWIKSFLTQT